MESNHFDVWMHYLAIWHFCNPATQQSNSLISKLLQGMFIEHLMSDWGAKWLKWTKFCHGGMTVKDPRWQAKGKGLQTRWFSSKLIFATFQSQKTVYRWEVDFLHSPTSASHLRKIWYGMRNFSRTEWDPKNTRERLRKIVMSRVSTCSYRNWKNCESRNRLKIKW